jgi:hypothetical protein
MYPMKSKMAHSLITILILTVCSIAQVQAVDDAEFEALEKQIEQLEADEKKKKAEAEAKRKAELEKQRLEEDKRVVEEERRAEEERKRLSQEKREEETQLTNLGNTELEVLKKQIKQMEKQIKQLETDKTDKTDKYDRPTGRNNEKEMNKMCYEVLGEWTWGWRKQEIILNEDGTFYCDTCTPKIHNWECHDPTNRKIKLIYETRTGKIVEDISELSEDGSCLSGENVYGVKNCWRRPDFRYEKEITEQQVPNL